MAAAGLLLLAGSAAAVLGDFAQPATSPEAVGDVPTKIAAGNLNGDAHTDLAVATVGDDDVSILLGTGTGDFAAPMTSPEGVSEDPTSIAIAQLGGDANLDIAVGDALTSVGGPGPNVNILLGDGTGNFTEKALTSPETTGVGAAEAMAAGNLNGDAHTDLAVVHNGHPDSAVTILTNDGTGDFTVGDTVNADTNGRGPAAADLDGDTDTDLAVPNNHNNLPGTISIFLNNGTGDFSETASSPVAAGTGPNGAAAGTFDSDSDMDLAVANGGSDGVTILLNNGMGDFTEKAMTSPEGAGDNPAEIVAADLNGDAHVDLATANFSDDTVSVMLGDGTGNFTTTSEAVGDEARALTAASLNGSSDAFLDLATANGAADNASILLNQPPATVPTPPPATTTPPASTAAPPTPKCTKKKRRAAGAKKKRCKKRKKRSRG